MKAVVWTKYGPPDVLALREVAKPVPQDNEVQIKIYATSVSAGDCEMRSLQFPISLRLPIRLYVGIRQPTRVTILGQELSGVVSAVGKDVTLFKEGDPVCATTGFSMGAYAEYICLRETTEDGVRGLKPANMSFAEAAAISFGAMDALFYIRKAQLSAGQQILINGAGGSIGTYAVQLAKHFGAQVTAVDSGDKLQMLSRIGADKVIDYTQTDFTRSGEVYDVVFDVVGKAPFARSMQALRENGIFLSANAQMSQRIRGRFVRGKQVYLSIATRTNADYDFLKELIEAGEIITVIDRQYPLAEMAEAHRYVESGRKAGNLIITVVDE